MRRRQSGAGLLVAVILIVTVAAFAVIVAASQSAGDVRGNDLHADSVEALFLAEAGVERALKRYATGVAACGAPLAESLTDLTQFGIANPSGRTISILAGLTNDFSGVTFIASQTQCRVRVTATINASNVSRTINAIVDRNLLEGPDNPTFNNPLTGAAPSGWTGINPAGTIAPNGGPDGTAPNCLRSAWTAKNNPGGQDRRASGTATVQFTLAAGVTSFWFHRRVLSRAADCGALPPAGPAMPAACGATGNDSQVCFQLIGTGGPGIWTTNPSANANTAGAGIAACPSTFNPCQTNYLPAFPAKVGPLNVTMTGATSVNQIVYWLRIQNGGRKEMFVDNIEAVNPTAIGAAHVRVWRDCSSAADPVNCV